MALRALQEMFRENDAEAARKMSTNCIASRNVDRSVVHTTPQLISAVSSVLSTGINSGPAGTSAILDQHASQPQAHPSLGHTHAADGMPQRMAPRFTQPIRSAFNPMLQAHPLQIMPYLPIQPIQAAWPSPSSTPLLLPMPALHSYVVSAPRLGEAPPSFTTQTGCAPPDPRACDDGGAAPLARAPFLTAADRSTPAPLFRNRVRLRSTERPPSPTSPHSPRLLLSLGSIRSSAGGRVNRVGRVESRPKTLA